MSKKTRIISAFPACGKTHLFDNGYEDSVIIDSDSSKFSWLPDGVTRNPDFPGSYIKHIKENVGKVDYILVSSHIDVRNALDASGLCWAFVAPRHSLMLEWVGRCWIRGSSEGFINTMIANWDSWTDVHNGPMPNGVSILSSNQYLSDSMRFLETLTYN